MRRFFLLFSLIVLTIKPAYSGGCFSTCIKKNRIPQAIQTDIENTNDDYIEVFSELDTEQLIEPKDQSHPPVIAIPVKFYIVVHKVERYFDTSDEILEEDDEIEIEQTSDAYRAMACETMRSLDIIIR